MQLGMALSCELVVEDCHVGEAVEGVAANLMGTFLASHPDEYAVEVSRTPLT